MPKLRAINKDKTTLDAIVQKLCRNCAAIAAGAVAKHLPRLLIESVDARC